MVSIPAGPSNIAVRDCAYGLARYAAITQNAGLVRCGMQWRVNQSCLLAAANSACLI